MPRPVERFHGSNRIGGHSGAARSAEPGTYAHLMVPWSWSAIARPSIPARGHFRRGSNPWRSAFLRDCFLPSWRLARIGFVSQNGGNPLEARETAPKELGSPLFCETKPIFEETYLRRIA
jgi:hypothetical protein